ncbi:hypothetical protein [Peribacillus sp. NPDC058002]|uniref:hypothetical protein n=1 Tax=Peribacillus sp. NPDC058002 TaxID=3346301 RepID=UPI0036DB1669
MISGGGASFKPAPDKWSIHQIPIQVTGAEVLSTHRLKKVMAEHEPLLLSFDQDGGANGLGDDPMDLEQYLLLFQLLRSSIQPILDHLTNEQSGRMGG